MSAWDNMFKQLFEFKKRFGHCNVTASSKGYEKLFHWCGNTRANLRKGKLSPERKKALDEIGFVPYILDDGYGIKESTN